MNEPAMAARFALSGTVLHDTIDDEVIVIDLTTGTYYSLRGTAAEVWGLLQRSPGMTHEELAQAVVVRYQTNGHDVEAAMTQFLGQLHAEGLVSEVPASPATPAVAAMVEPSTTPAPEFVGARAREVHGHARPRADRPRSRCERSRVATHRPHRRGSG